MAKTKTGKKASAKTVTTQKKPVKKKKLSLSKLRAKKAKAKAKGAVNKFVKPSMPGSRKKPKRDKVARSSLAKKAKVRKGVRAGLPLSKKRKRSGVNRGGEQTAST